MSGTPQPTERELEDAFVKITFQDDREEQNRDPLYPQWTAKSECYRSSCAFLRLLSHTASALWSEPLVFV